MKDATKVREDVLSVEVSIVVVSYNTKDMLEKCLHNILIEAEGIQSEIFVIDNASRDNSAKMIADQFPEIRLIQSPVNLGFAAANNLGFKQANGRYVLIINSDAFPKEGCIRKAILHMNTHPNVGLAGGQLISEDGSWQPSARQFPSILNDFLMLSGLAEKYPRSRFFGKADRTWADPDEEAEVDWVPGAFAIMRREVLEKVNFFDERFFLYFEEVDLCKQIKNAGFKVMYWPDLIIIHIGGQSSKNVAHLKFSENGRQLILWQMRSRLLYYRKHFGWLTTFLIKNIDIFWHSLRLLKNTFFYSTESSQKKLESRNFIDLMNQAWKETKGGTISPTKPW